ncbi:hypothetical protein Back11_60630 [Paenibacillus baekrokdamisoli]|uniref:Uncharacterized protein n=1 Tax=Paenibacillus baekrokdamisoli TaxID=1712516 RepID=A0A3G9JKQ4_9BACL|nr:hypothetical protein [Paenibacillus baekrokdamisoli]MBB3072134.1 hypothetical protein [Paenibacillus baekrokdamisoli]BBH24718.1 hypothetical protein Back11_60630 [Paenibacillus baekrokdamisoli]
MEPIFPLHEDHINKFCGVPVCIITHDGNRHVGILTSCHNGRVMLNGSPEQQHKSSFGSQGTKNHEKGKNKLKGKKGAKPKKAVTESKAQAQAISSNDPFNGNSSFSPFGDFFAIDLAQIAFLFLLL